MLLVSLKEQLKMIYKYEIILLDSVVLKILFSYLPYIQLKLIIIDGTIRGCSSR